MYARSGPVVPGAHLSPSLSDGSRVQKRNVINVLALFRAVRQAGRGETGRGLGATLCAMGEEASAKVRRLWRIADCDPAPDWLERHAGPSGSERASGSIFGPNFCDEPERHFV
jgi:hypothetical protein